MSRFESAPAYGELDGERKTKLDAIHETIASWPDVSDSVKEEIRKKSNSFLDTYTSGTNYRFAGGQIGFLHWIVKNDDLKLMEQLIPAAMAIVTFLSVANAPVAVMVAGLAFSTLGIANKLRNKSILLNAEDFHVLMTLKHAGPSTASRIAEILSGLHIYGREVWDEARVVAVLDKLKLIPQNDGTAATVVNQASDGRWSAAGI